MLIDEIIEFELRGPRPPGRTCTPKVVIFMTNQKFIKDNL